ncbi:MAG: hypothetical protein E6G66_09290 [Actinobacteria bacterium]|nr:MAG: hypothetical protein E6G66_09290 [Actinomycetota bacterium]
MQNLPAARCGTAAGPALPVPLDVRPGRRADRRSAVAEPNSKPHPRPGPHIQVAAPPPTAESTSGAGVTAIGDSVMLDAAPNLRALVPGITIDAVVSRGVDAGIAGMRSLAGAGQLGASVIVHLGTNGSFTPDEMDQLVAVAAGRQLVLLTDHCPYCSWTPSNNAVIQAGCTSARRCTVADWNSLAVANPQWFGKDGVHMPIGGTGGQAYAELVVQHL